MTNHSAVPNPCNSILERSSSYRNKCTNPTKMPDGSTPWKNQIHHILCEHAILDISPRGDSDGSKLAFIKECLCMADWDINDSSNLIGLPLKSAYRNSNGETPSNYPCHNVDHNTADGYTNEVKKWLHANVWNTIINKKKSHQVNADSIISQLKNCTSTFKGVITKRGKRNKGTKSSWKNRFEQPDDWYKPFSMSSNPTPRSPGGRWNPSLFKMIR